MAGPDVRTFSPTPPCPLMVAVSARHASINDKPVSASELRVATPHLTEKK